MFKKEPSVEDIQDENIEQDEIDETNKDVYPESITELNKWIIDPDFKKKFDMIVKDAVISYLTETEIDRIVSKFDLAYQCQQIEMDMASNFFVFLNAAKLNVNRSKLGFERKQQTTITQEKSLDISRQKDKNKGRFGRW